MGNDIDYLEKRCSDLENQVRILERIVKDLFRWRIAMVKFDYRILHLRFGQIFPIGINSYRWRCVRTAKN